MVMIAQQQRIVKKVYFITILVIFLLGAAFSLFLIQAFPERSAPNQVGHILLPCVGLASNLLASWLCRYLGLSLAGKNTEIIRRRHNSALHNVFVTAELRTARSHWLALALLLTSLCLLPAAMGFASPLPSDKIVPFYMAACFAVGAATMWWAYFTRAGLLASISGQGIEAKKSDWKSLSSGNKSKAVNSCVKTT